MKLKIGKLRIGLEFPFFALAAFFLSGDMWKNYLLAVIFSTLHELGHIVSMKISGCEIREICTDIMGIRIDKRISDMSYERECITALSGPLVNLFAALVFCALQTKNEMFILPFNINLGLFFINMLPIRTLDGGRFLSSLMLIFFDEDKVRRISVITEIVVALFLIAVLILSLVFNVVNTSFVFFVICLVTMIVFGFLKS